MDIVRTFGGTVASQAKVNPDRARRLLMTGWRAKQAQLALAPDKRLPKSRQYAGRLAMDTILKAMSHPDRAAAISIFTPYEPLEAAGILPYSVEQMSSFLAGTKCEGAFLETAGLHGFCETMCSYHRTFLGALSSGIVPKPRFAVYTNLACDGNLITFPFLEQKLGIPGFCIDVPFERSEEAVADVARQIREMTEFVGDVTGKPVDEDRLREAVARGCESAAAYRAFLASSPGKRLPSDMVSEMYAFLTNHLLMGTKETLRFCRMLEHEMKEAPQSDGVRLIWMNTMPYSQQPVIDAINCNDRAFVVASDLAADHMLIEVDPGKPYEAMARRMVYSAFGGCTQARIDRELQLARMTQADGAVFFAHWGCKATLGISTMMKNALEEAGLPCLILDGDGLDESNRSDGQVATRLGAFLEMLEARKAEGKGAL